MNYSSVLKNTDPTIQGIRPFCPIEIELLDRLLATGYLFSISLP